MTENGITSTTYILQAERASGQAGAAVSDEADRETGIRVVRAGNALQVEAKDGLLGNFTLYDLLGRKVCEASGHSWMIDGSQFVPGTYMLSFENNSANPRKSRTAQRVIIGK